MRPILLILAILITASINSQPRRERTTQSIKTAAQSTKGSFPSTVKNGKTAYGEIISPDDIILSINDSTASMIPLVAQLSGYDKPVNASRETMHITNLSDSLSIVSITIHLQYLDSQNRELHQRDIDLYDHIEPQHTELVTFPTWDIQRSFYYILSTHPRRQATPYDLRATITSVTLR